MSNDELQNMLREVDENNDGYLDFEGNDNCMISAEYFWNTVICKAPRLNLVGRALDSNSKDLGSSFTGNGKLSP